MKQRKKVEKAQVINEKDLTKKLLDEVARMLYSTLITSDYLKKRRSEINKNEEDK